MSVTLIGKHEKDSRANRDGYVEAMLEMMAENDKLVHIDCDLMGCINTGKLLKAYPARTFNAGIAEQNAMGVAAGMAATGLTALYIRSAALPPAACSTRRSCPQAILSCRCMSSARTRA